MELSEVILLILNLVLGIGLAFPLAKNLRRALCLPAKTVKYFAILIALYFIESLFLVMGMGIPVCGIGLALVWGLVLGYQFQSRSSDRHDIVRTAFFVSFYSSLPAFSFIVIPVLGLLSGTAILSVEYGHQFGIPGFLPRPINTVLGFYVSLAVGSLLLKSSLTTGTVVLLTRDRAHKALLTDA